MPTPPPTSLSEPCHVQNAPSYLCWEEGGNAGRGGVQREARNGRHGELAKTPSAHSLFLCFPVQRTVPCLTLCWLPSGSPAARPAPTFRSATASSSGSPPQMGCPGASVLWTSTGDTPFPGLWDEHVHMTQWALAANRIDLSLAESARGAVDLVRSRISGAGPGDAGPTRTGPARTLVGVGFRDAVWDDVPGLDTARRRDPGRADGPDQPRSSLCVAELSGGRALRRAARRRRPAPGGRGVCAHARAGPPARRCGGRLGSYCRRRGGRPRNRGCGRLRDDLEPRRLAAPHCRRIRLAPGGRRGLSGGPGTGGSCGNADRSTARRRCGAAERGSAEGADRRVPQHPHRVLRGSVSARRPGNPDGERSGAGGAAAAGPGGPGSFRRFMRSATPPTRWHWTPSLQPASAGESSTRSLCGPRTSPVLPSWA